MTGVPELGLAFAKALAPSAVGVLRGYGLKKYNELIVHYTQAFKEHLLLTQQRCSTVKTLVSGDVGSPLLDLYVPLTFKSQYDDSLKDSGILDRCMNGPEAFVICGLAGSGKSMFMKWLALQLIYQLGKHQKIPLFIEIRDVPSEDLDRDLEDLLFRNSSALTDNRSFEQFRIGLKAGMFVILLDGLDETPIEKHDALVRSIKKFRERWATSALICSVRPGSGVSNLARLQTAHVNAMALDQIVSVVEKSPFEEKRKSIFIEELKSGLYEQHESFLSNPLLAVIMLITFENASKIPTNLAAFYAQAFEALFYRHDWSKGVYVREHYTKLEIDEFEEVFRNFCFVTYFKRKFSFQANELRESMKDAISRCNATAKTQDFIKDCLVSVCLLQEDAPFITFVHRSFQEYFAAKYVSRYSGEHLFRIIDRIVDHFSVDSTFKLLVQLNPEGVKRSWALPACKTLIERFEIGLSQGPAGMTELIQEVTSDISVDQNTGEIVGLTWSRESLVSRIRALQEAVGYEEAGLFKIVMGSVYPNGERNAAPRRLVDLVRRGLARSNGESAEISTSELEAAFIDATGIPDIIRNAVQSLRVVRTRLEKELAEQDAFVFDIEESA